MSNDFTADEDYFPPSESESNPPPPTDSTELLFKCEKCSKAFKSNFLLKTHEATHENLRAFKCIRAGCKSDFNNPAHLIRHLKKVHDAEAEEVAIAKIKVKEMRPIKKDKEITETQIRNGEFWYFVAQFLTFS